MGTTGAMTKDNPARKRRDRTIAQARAAGGTVRAIAKETNLSPSRVSEVLNDDDVKAMVEHEARRLASLVPRVYDGYEALSSPEAREKDPKLHLEAIRDISKIAGLQGTANQGTVYNVLYQDNRSQTLDPSIMNLLDKANESEVIDIELDLD